MQIVLLGAAIINQVFTAEWGTTLVLVVLTIFNAVLGLRGEAKAEADKTPLQKQLDRLTMIIAGLAGVALGFDKPAPDLMKHKPRPLKQPILSRSQWVRVVLLGVLAAVCTVYFESVYEQVSVETAATMGFVAFAFLVIAMGLSARSETSSAFNRDILSDRNQLRFMV
jgi:magnesium-transporting ATPase (P-type)